MKRIEIAGLRFGRLYVIEATGINAKWRCICDCGSRVEVYGGALRTGNTRSCGCMKIENARARVGQLNFNAKTVVDYQGAHARVYRTRGKASAHPCVDCGQPAQDWSYDGKDPSELRGGDWNCRYSLSPDHYLPRCKPCHAVSDDWASTRRKVS